MTALYNVMRFRYHCMSGWNYLRGEVSGLRCNLHFASNVFFINYVEDLNICKL